MKLFLSFLSCTLGLGLLLASCKTPPKVSGVSVTVAEFQPGDPAVSADHPVMVLHFISDSVNPIGFSKSSYKLYLNGVYAGKATSETPVGVPPMGTVTLNVPFTLENPKAVRQALGVSGEMCKYRLESVLFFTEDDQKGRITPSFEGSVSLTGLESALH